MNFDLDRISAKNQLLKSAQVLFADKDFDAVGVNEIADSAKQNVSLINYYFGGKKGLYEACIEDFASKRLGISKRILNDPSSPEDFRLRLKLFVGEILNSYIENPHAMRLAHRACESQQPINDDLFRQFFLKVFENVKAYLKKGQELGFVKKNLDLHISSLLFFGMVVQFTRTEQINKTYFGFSLSDPEFRENVIQNLTNIFLVGVV